MVRDLSTIVDTLPANVFQARALLVLEDPEERVEVWQRVVETAPVNERWPRTMTPYRTFTLLSITDS